MTLRQLATHVAELPSWISMTLTTDEPDFASNPYQPVPTRSKTDLLNYFEKSLTDGKEELSHAQESQLSELWTLRNVDEVYSTSTRSNSNELQPDCTSSSSIRSVSAFARYSGSRKL